MKSDPIIAEIHRIRRAHAKRFNYDLAAIFADIRKWEAKSGNVVDLTRGKHLETRVAETHTEYGKKPRSKR